MAHLAQKQFCELVKQRYPKFFKNCNILDVGSLDVNGNNNYLFDQCNIDHLDIGPGPNVDIVQPVHLYAKKYLYIPTYDTVISCEMLEHDQFAEKSVKAMVKLTRPGGLLIITCAGLGRKQHGFKDQTPQDSPHTNDYYQNIEIYSLVKWLGINKPFQLCNEYESKVFKAFYFSSDLNDIYFYGIKK